MKTQSNRKAQRGFALLEVLLAIIIIAIVSLAVVELYSRATASGALSTEEAIIGQITTAHQQYVAANYKAVADSQALVDAGLLPADLLDTAKTSFIAPFGAIEYTPDPDSYSKLTLVVNGVPGQTQSQFCVDMVKAYDVNDGTTDYDTASDCLTGFSDDQGGVGSGTFTLTSPKGAADDS